MKKNYTFLHKKRNYLVISNKNLLHLHKHINKMAKILNDSNFLEVIKETKTPILVDFWADWCRPCKMMNPVLEELEKEIGEEALICKVDIESAKEIAMSFGIRSIPTFLFFKDGEIYSREVGMVDKKVLKKKLKEGM